MVKIIIKCAECGNKMNPKEVCIEDGCTIFIIEHCVACTMNEPCGYAEYKFDKNAAVPF